MNNQISSQKLWLALSLLGSAYALMGWYLAAHHIFWLVSTFVVGTTLTIAWRSNPVLEFLTWLTKQQVLVLVSASLLFSLIVALTLIKPILLSLILLPLFTLLYALLEMRAAGLKQLDLFLWLVIVAGLGLGIGEVIDLFVAPSMRY